MASGGPNGRTFSAGGKDSSSGSGGGGNYGKGNGFGQSSSYSTCCGHQHQQNANPVRITAKVLFGSVSAISSLNAERCRKRAQ